MTLQEQQLPIDRQLVSALIEATPETWSAAALHVIRADEKGNERMEVEITSPEGHKEPIGATDEIYEALYALSDCFRAHGKVWKKVTYVAEMGNDENWRYKASFEY